MKRILFSIAWILMTVLCMAGSSSAALVGGPSPVPGFGNDDGTELFMPANVVLNFELYDLGGLTTGSTFGFYFQGTDVSDPANRITIFGPGDDTTSLNDIQRASILFSLGIVVDTDASPNQIQSMFSNLPGANIGFFFSILGSQIYTEAALNGGLDLSATFPSLNYPLTYLIGFQGLQGGTIALEVSSGLMPVPEPSSMLLIGSGLAGWALLRRKVRK